MTTTPKPAPAPEAPKERVPDPMCICGEPETPNVVHSTTGPCFRAPAPEPKPCGICKGAGFYNTVYRDRIRCPNLCGDPNPILPTKAPEPQGSACKHGVTPPNICASCAAIKPWEAGQGIEEPIGTEKAFDSATAWIELNAAKLGNIKLDGLTNLAEAFISLRNREKADYAAFVEMNAVFEAVMRAIRGEALSDFDLSHGSVYEANALRAEVEAARELCLRRMSEVTQERNALRAELAQAREETIRSNGAVAVERAAREKAEKEWDYFDRRATKAEARVKVLEDLVTVAVDQRWLSDVIAYLGPEARAILAARAKEGEKR